MPTDYLNTAIGYLGEWRELVVTALHVLLILGLSWLVLCVARKAVARLRWQMQHDDDDPERIKRLNTQEQVFRYIILVVVTLVTAMLVLSEVGISIAPILAAAGVLGIAIGFGALSLVKDYFTGLFLLLENLIRQGDVVEVAGKGGLVEEITLRYIRLRDYDGNVHFIPNGTITTVSNMSREYAYAVIDLKISFKEDVGNVIKLMQEVS